MELSSDIVPYLDDNIQLSIEEYRGKLYEVMPRHPGADNACYNPAFEVIQTLT